MSYFSIGLSGLEVAQRAIELIGTNIANASSPGYHRQELDISPRVLGHSGAYTLGGAQIEGTRRMMDLLLEREILHRHPAFGQVSQELVTLKTMEGLLGTVDSQNLGKALTDFFEALRQLSAEPSSQILRMTAIRTAEALAVQFNSLGSSLGDLQESILLQAESLMAKMNGLAAEIAQLNDEIQVVTLRNGNANLLRDRRDQAILELADLGDIRAQGQSTDSPTVTVMAWGLPLVTSGSAIELEVGLMAEGKIGISVKDANYFHSDLRGGRLGGLLALRNEIVAEIESNLDLLAKQVITGINQYHCQGLGTAGSFTSLAGWPVSDETLDQWDAEISAGTIYVRVTDLGTGQVSRSPILVDPSTQTISDIATSLDAVAGLSASVTGSALRIVADNGYEFDFLPALLEDPSGLTGTATPTISGLYQGAENQTFTCTIIGDGDVGVETGLTVEVRNEASELVARLNVGAGYAPGERLEVMDGISVAFTAGTLNDSESFSIEALADSDTSGLLAAAGINTFFRGDSARAMGVCAAVLADPGRLATAVGAELSDNKNIIRMTQLGETPVAALGDVTPNDFYRLLVTGVGENVRFREATRNSLENILQQLANEWNSVSGVDINEEAARLLIFERMYQAAAKFIAVQDQSLKFLMELV